LLRNTDTGQQGRKRTHLILGTQHDGLGDRAERLHQLNQVGLRRTDDKDKHRLSARAVKTKSSFRKTRIAPGTESKKTKVRDLALLSYLGDLVPDVPDVDHLGRLRHPSQAGNSNGRPLLITTKFFLAPHSGKRI
jgi:hypothetical protein